MGTLEDLQLPQISFGWMNCGFFDHLQISPLRHFSFGDILLSLGKVDSLLFVITDM